MKAALVSSSIRSGLRGSNDESLTCTFPARIGSTLIPLTEQPLQKLRTAVENKTIRAEKWATNTDRTCEFIIVNPIRIFKVLNRIRSEGTGCGHPCGY